MIQDNNDNKGALGVENSSSSTRVKLEVDNNSVRSRKGEIGGEPNASACGVGANRYVCGCYLCYC